LLNKKDKNATRQKRHMRMRRNIIGTAERPRLNVYRSLSNIYAQIINDVTGENLLFLLALLKKPIKKSMAEL